MERRGRSVFRAIWITLLILIISAICVDVWLFRMIGDLKEERRNLSLASSAFSVSDFSSEEASADTVDPSSDTVEAVLAIEPSVPEPTGKKAPIYATGRLRKYVINVMFAAEDKGKAEMLVLFSYNMALSRVTAVSFLRDQSLPVQGYGEETLAAAYAYGGIGMVINTINEAYGLDIKTCATVTLRDLIKLIDRCGGLEIRLSDEEASNLSAAANREISAGNVLVSGREAMFLATDRVSGGNGDFSRCDRQMRLVHSFLRAMRNGWDQEDAMRALLKTIFKMLDTNMTIGEMGTIGKEIIKADQIRYDTAFAPADGTWSYVQRDENLVVSADIEKNRMLMEELLYGE